MLRVNCEAVMWKVTTRGFTLEEVLIMAAMTLLTSADTAAKHENHVLGSLLQPLAERNPPTATR